MATRSRNYKENLTYLILWLALFLSPILSMYIRMEENADMQFDWYEIFRVWKSFALYLFVFLLHNYVLAPILVYRHRRALYLSSVGCLVVLFFVVQCLQKPDERDMRGIHDREMYAGEPFDRRGKVPPMAGEKTCESGAYEPDGKRMPHHPAGEAPFFHPPLILGERPIIASVMLILLVGMNLGVKLYFKSDDDMKEMALLEKQNLEQQLEYLKYQINPHFFMNTLNNIHALVDIDPDKAKLTILELSKMMRYVLYEANKTIVPLQHEIRFLHNYITLMRLRFTDKVSISVTIPDDIPDKGILPLMLITFVENAFKHGVSYRQESFISIAMTFTEERFTFVCRNSKHKNADMQNGGVGLENVRKRLDLFYGEDFTLTISDNEDAYEVSLDAPLTVISQPVV